MGEIAEDMTDGTCCDICGCYYVDDDDNLYTHGYPATCWDCWSDMTKDEKEHHQKSQVQTL